MYRLEGLSFQYNTGFGNLGKLPGGGGSRTIFSSISSNVMFCNSITAEIPKKQSSSLIRSFNAFSV